MEPETLLNPFVAVYLLLAIGIPLVVGRAGVRRRAAVARRRAAQGLPPDVIVSATERLSTTRREAYTESLVFLATVILTPFALIAVARLAGWEEPAQGLGLAFAGLIVWAMLSGTDVAKAFLGGLAFRTLVAMRRPFQVGDRVSLKGQNGKVTRLGTFFVTLETSTDDLVSIPTSTLWSEVLVSVNAGDRSSLCVMKFYLAHDATADHRQMAENTIWSSIQGSVYLESAKPMQIYVAQTETSICLTAHAYVASTYDEPNFASAVTSAFLDTAAREGIPLAGPPRYGVGTAAG